MLILPADHLVRKALLWFGSIFLTLQLNAPPLVAQDAVVAEVQDAVVAKVADTLENEGAEEGEYIVATDLLPGSVAGLLRIPNLPDLAEGWSKTHLGQLLQDDAMQPYLESQRDQAIGYLNSISSKVGLNTKDLHSVC